MKLKILFCLSFGLAYLFVFLANKKYKYPNKKEIEQRINYLERVINEPLDNNSEIIKLGNSSYEWMLFSYSFSTYALTSLTIKDTSYREKAIKIIKTAINKSLDQNISSPYDIELPLLESDSIPDYSVLYLGHLNLMLGCLRLISNDTTYNQLNDKISESLHKRYRESPILNLESYSSCIWIPDNTVALASLKLHSINTGSQYGSICEQWVNYVKNNYIDKETGVLFSTIQPSTGKASEEPRGSMLGWSIMFVYQFDADFAQQLYKNYKDHFSINLGILRLFKERYNCNKTDIGDIDSGPIFYGFSIPANEFALSGAIISKDNKTAKKLQRLISIGASSNKENNELRYKTRFLDINISPMAEAIVLHSLTITNWSKSETEH